MPASLPFWLAPTYPAAGRRRPAGRSIWSRYDNPLHDAW